MLVVKNPPSNAASSFPGLGRSPGGGHGNPLQYSCLENPHGRRSLARYSPWYQFSSVWLFVTPWTGLPGSSVHGILQARILGWVALPFSRGSSRSGVRTRVSCGLWTAGRIFTAEHLRKPIGLHRVGNDWSSIARMHSPAFFPFWGRLTHTYPQHTHIHTQPVNGPQASYLTPEGVKNWNYSGPGRNKSSLAAFK